MAKPTGVSLLALPPSVLYIILLESGFAQSASFFLHRRLCFCSNPAVLYIVLPGPAFPQVPAIFILPRRPAFAKIRRFHTLSFRVRLFRKSRRFYTFPRRACPPTNQAVFIRACFCTIQAVFIRSCLRTKPGFRIYITLTGNQSALFPASQRSRILV